MATTRRGRARTLGVLAVLSVLGVVAVPLQGPNVAEAQGGVIRSLPGCTANALARNDDGSTAAVPLGFTLQFATNQYTNVFVNNNGNVTFDSPLGQYTPNGLRGDNRRIIAPFFADVDTRGTASEVVRYGNGVSDGQPYFCVNWLNVGYYASHTDKLNSFQLVLWSVGQGGFDIEFNYQRILWETGDASGGTNGFGGESAHAGFSNGQPCPQPAPAPCPGSLELPGSGVSRALIDGGPNSLTGHGDLPTLPGRYRFPVRNGNLPTGTISGTVVNPSQQPVAGSLVNLCNQTVCSHATSNADGQYAFPGVPDGTWGLVAFPPAEPNPASVLFPAQVFGLVVQNGLLQLPPGASTTLMLTNPRQPRAGVSVGPTLIPGVTGQTVVSALRDLVIRATRPASCSGGASFSVTQGTVVIASGPMTDVGGGVLEAIVPASALIGRHGPATVTITWDCGAPADVIDIYLDPSGTVRDLSGAPVAGATVTLLRADTAAGPFTPVPNGSVIMSPSNRRNPDTTDAQGMYHWDVITGFYKVRVEKTGCFAPGNPGQTLVESAVLPVPPPQFNVDLVLDCPSATQTPTPTTTATPTQTATATQAATATTTAGTTPTTCPLRSQGDANCDDRYTLSDYTIWRNQFLGTDPGRTADFNGDGRVTLTDYTIWRNSFLAGATP